MPSAKRREQFEAQRLRRELGMPMKQIAARLNVSVASVHAWTREIEISEAQRTRNLIAARARRGELWRETNRQKRLEYQEEGRRFARSASALHQAGCMLYWAEGAKERGELAFTNSDRAMVVFFWRFLRDCLDVDPGRVRLRLNAYLNNGLSLREIEDWWLVALGLPHSCLQAHTLDHYPTSSSGRKRSKLPYGVCTLRVYDTRLTQHVFGAIQEYADFVEPRWVNGRSAWAASPPRPKRSADE